MTQPMPSLPGMPEQIARYQLLGELGRGSMGHVYLALDPNIDRKVALKIFLPLLKVGVAEQWELRQRFVFEARAAGQLNHPGIVTIFDADTDSDTGLSYLAMEWVNGPSLDDLIRESAPLAVDRSVRIVGEVAEALHVAHRQGLVHRDIKPANILLESDGRAKVTDFGIAKLASMSITTTGWIPGSPFYMSPEQIRNESIDRRSDLYALGVVLYQCLTGKLPFEAESLAALTHMILEIDPRPVRSINPEVSPELAAVIETALAKSPDDRFDSGRQFARALQLARAGRFEPPTPGRKLRAAAPPVDEGGADSDVAAGWGTGTISLEAPSREGPDIHGPEPGNETGWNLIPEGDVEVRPAAGRAGSAGGAILSTGSPAIARAIRNKPLLAAVVILTLILVAWGLRPVASESAGDTPSLVRLFSAAPRFSAATLPGEGGIEIPSEPAEVTPPEAPAEIPRLPEVQGPAWPETQRPAPPGAQGSALPAADPGPGGVAGQPSAASSAAAAGGTPAAAVEAPTVEPAAVDASPALPSAPPARASSTLEIVYRNRLKNATLSVSIDDEGVYDGRLEGQQGLFGKAFGKNVWAALELTPGVHVVDVRITGAGGKPDMVRRTEAIFEDGRTHRLRVSVTPLKRIKLAWKESPGG